MEKTENGIYQENWKEALRNQLNIISTSIYLMEKNIASHQSEDAMRYIQKMKEAMERIKILLE